MQYLPSTILWVLIIAWIVYVVFIKKGQNRKAAQTGEDKARVKQAVGQLPDGAANPQIVYAHWEEQESYGRTVRTTYYRYAAAFHDQTLWVFPLHVDKKTHQVQANQPAALTAERLGKVIVNTKEKDGAVSRVDVSFLDKEGKSIVHLYVDAECLRKNRWFPLNILQQEECEAFARFITTLSQKVAAENPGIDAVIDANAKSGMGVIGVILSAVGVIGGLGFPPIGAVLCLLGLILSLVGWLKGTREKMSLVCLIISAVCAAGMALFCWVYLTYLFV